MSNKKNPKNVSFQLNISNKISKTIYIALTYSSAISVSKITNNKALTSGAVLLICVSKSIPYKIHVFRKNLFLLNSHTNKVCLIHK